MNLKDLLVLRYAGDVERLHTARIKPQSLAHHSWNVALLLITVYPECSKELLQYALTHDLPELDTGDVPANAKWAEPTLEEGLRKLEQRFIKRNGLTSKDMFTPEEQEIVKWCDGAELLMYCAEQVQQGNRYAIEVMDAIHIAMINRGIPQQCRNAWTAILWFADDAIKVRSQLTVPGLQVAAFESEMYVKDTQR